MMTAEDVAEVVVFVLERPRHLRILETALPADDRGELGMSSPVTLGHPLDRAHQPARDPGRARVAEGRAARRSRAATAARAEAYAREWEIPRAYGSYEELLADPEIEAVYISLPNTLHCEWSIRALEAGKHVLCEKPFSRHPDEVEAAFDAAERAGRLALGGVHVPPQPADRARARARRGGRDRRAAARALGVQLLALRRGQHPPAHRRRGRRADGRRLLLRERLAAPRRASPSRCSARPGSARPAPTGCSPATMRFPGDVLAQFDCGTALPERDELEAIGSEGSLFLDDPWHCTHAGDRAAARAAAVERIELEPVDSYRLELENLSDAIRGEARAAARPRGRGRAGARARGAAPLGGDRRAGRV